jgi:hypothetical protein
MPFWHGILLHPCVCKSKGFTTIDLSTRPELATLSIIRSMGTNEALKRRLASGLGSCYIKDSSGKVVNPSFGE